MMLTTKSDAYTVDVFQVHKAFMGALVALCGLFRVMD